MDSLNLGQKLDDAAQPESVTILICSGRGNICRAAWLRLFWGSDQAVGGESCEAELHQLLFTSLFY